MQSSVLSIRAIAAVSVMVALAGPAISEPARLPPGFDPARHMRVSEVRAGMKGHGLSVFKGTQPERFDVEVISVLRNFTPQHDVVLVKCSGANLQHTGAVAGMSGSPVYLDDGSGRSRMIGAFAYGWSLMKDPIGGVQPIEYMLAMPQRSVLPQTVAPTTRASARMTWDVREAIYIPGMARAPRPWLDTPHLPGLPGTDLGVSPLRPAPPQERLLPLAAPVMVSGLGSSLFERVASGLGGTGLVALQAGSVASPVGPVPDGFVPGGVMAVPLLTGDIELTALGTCTEVLDDRVYGFGHAFQSEGASSLPLATGQVHTVIANLNVSFKLGAMGQIRGTLSADQTVGIAGRIGPAPALVPVSMKVLYTDGSLDRTYRYQVAPHPRFTPLLTAIALQGALAGKQNPPQYHTVEYELDLEFVGGQKLSLRNVSVNSAAVDLLHRTVACLTAAAQNPFERVMPSKVSGVVRVMPEARESRILTVNVPRLKYQPGETVKGFITHRPFRGSQAVMPVSFELPHDLPDGVYQFTISDSQGHLSQEQQTQPFRFAAQSSEEVFSALRDVLGVRNDALYLRLTRRPDGIALGRTAMPRLPSSMRQVLLGAGLSNVTPFVSSTVKIIPTDLVMSGSAQFTITIDKGDRLEPARGRPRRDGPPSRPDDVRVRPVGPNSGGPDDID